MRGERTMDAAFDAVPGIVTNAEAPSVTPLTANRPAAAGKPEAGGQPSVAEREHQPSTILVTDDSESIVDLLSTFLEAKRYRVLRAANGAEAIELAAAHQPDLILLDVMMPEMDGLTACRHLKADPELRAIPVIMITAMHEIEDIVRGFDAGADDYVTKPINFRILGARVRSALRVKTALDAVALANRELEAELSRRKRVEVELAQSHKLEAIGRLAAGIAHEINTPVQYIGDNIRFLAETFGSLQQLLATATSISEEIQRGGSPSELLARFEVDADRADVTYLSREIPCALRQSQEGVEQIAGIVRAMKEFSHPGSEERQATNINHLIENTLAIARSQWKHVADLVIDLDPALPPVPCVAAAIRQVVLNLLVNAAEAIGEAIGRDAKIKGTITVRTRLEGDWIEVQVVDTGGGIPEEIRPRIFEPFFTTKDVGKGTGQGLAMAHTTIVEKHGGSLCFDTEVGRGTTFVVRLPLPARSEIG